MGGRVTPAAMEACFVTDAVGLVSLPTMTRKALPALFASRGYTSGAEIGVWYGAFSEKLCLANPALRLLCVDAWAVYPGWSMTKREGAALEALMADAYVSAQKTLAAYPCELRRGFSVAIAPTIPDRSLDFVYIDANHAYDAVLEDLRLWAPKVKVGGVISGHDYCVNPGKSYIQVIEAVETYTHEQGIETIFVLAGDRTPSFLWVNR